VTDGRAGQRFGTVIRLRPGHEAEYRALHEAVWPSVLTTLKDVNIRNYSIFVRDGLLFSYMEYTGDDWAADSARMAADPETRRWWTFTNLCQQPVATAADGEWWAPMEEVFHLD